MIHNILVANYLNGQIQCKTIAAEKVPDEMIRDGWVEVHREVPPSITAVVAGGELKEIYTSIPAVKLKVVDLDDSERPDQERAKLRVLHSEDFYHMIKA